MHTPNFTAQLTDKEAVRKAASNIGAIGTRGREKGKGSIREMLENIGIGEVLVMFHQYDEPNEMRSTAKELLDISELYPKLQNTLRGMASALEHAASLKEDHD